MKTLVASPFKDDLLELVEWLYGVDARVVVANAVNYGMQRPGQAFMNMLRVYDPDGYVRLAGRSVDPFYKDEKIPEALDKLTSK